MTFTEAQLDWLISFGALLASAIAFCMGYIVGWYSRGWKEQ